MCFRNASCSDVITVPLFFSPPSPYPWTIIPDARPLGTFENQDIKMAMTVRRGISKRSHEKIGDCEQSIRLGNLPSLKVIPPKWAKISHHKVAQFCRRLDSRGHELAPISGSQWGGSSDDWRLIFSDFDGYYVEFYHKSHNDLLLLYKCILTSVFWSLSWPFTYKISK